LTDKLLNAYKQKIKGLRLIPDKGGCFELKVDGDLIYSKLATGRFPDENAMLAEVKKRVK
jgi:selenoprotein W-related protein